MNKGVVSKILPADETPRDSKGKLFEIIANPQGVPSRKNSGQLLELYMGKIVHHVNEKITKLIESKSYIKVINAVETMYVQLMNDSPHRKAIIASLKKLKSKSNEAQLNKFILYISKNKVSFFNDPIQSLEIKNIVKALHYYGLKPKEKVYDPSIGGMTKNPVTFGYMYWEKTIHLSAKKMSARSIGPMQTATNQAKRVSGESGQRVDELSVHTLLSYGVYNYLTEISTLSSDDVDSKYQAIQKIYKEGKIRLSDLKGIKSTTSTQMSTILVAMGVVDPEVALKNTK